MSALAALLIQAAALFPQGGAIGLTPPADMREASDFTGFANAAGDSIVIAELPREAWPQLVERLSATPPGRPLPNGVILDGPGDLIKLPNGERAVRWRGHQQVGGTRHAKWIVLAESAETTAVVTAQVEASRAADRAPAIEAALATLRFQRPADLESAIAALPFVIGDRAGFRAVRTLMGSGLILTEGPRDTDPDGAQPLVVIASSLDKRAPPDRAGFARKLFEGQPNFTRLTVGDVTTGGDRVTITGTAVDRARYVTLRQHLRFVGDGGYLRTMCIWPVADDLTQRCDRLAASVAPR
ncbi:hypothetical protein [Sphingomonas sp.]|uniref:hypothetical protein n=1 Tax=Sphingomonas sp. TaxID=28214 RepID=UPI002CEACDB9|nr:hypothetical protein [Sphingomonas sp.]HTG37781.1 hypothetical protein [Sphingomonas sp.]